MFPYSRAVTPWVKGPKRPQMVLASSTSFPSLSFFFPHRELSGYFFFSLILLLRCNFFLFYSDHPIRTLLSPEFLLSLFNDRKCLAQLGKGCEQGAPSIAVPLWVSFFFPKQLAFCSVFCQRATSISVSPDCGSGISLYVGRRAIPVAAPMGAVGSGHLAVSSFNHIHSGNSG